MARFFDRSKELPAALEDRDSAPLASHGLPGSGRNRLLAALPPPDFGLLAAHLVECKLEAGTVLHEPGQKIARVYFPYGGLVSLLGVLPGGRATEVATIGRESAVGLTIRLSSPVAVNRAVVQIPGTAMHIAPARLVEVAAQSKALRGVVLRHCELLLLQLQQSVVCNTVHDAQQRVSRWLLDARYRMDGAILPVTQGCLSSLLGLQRTTVTAVCRTLQSRNIIRVRRGNIHILDYGALEREACVCHQLVQRLINRNGLQHLAASA